jgi:hypothetical protein
MPPAFEKWAAKYGDVFGKPDSALEFVDKSLARYLKPDLILIDSGFSNNTTLTRLEIDKSSGF